MDAELHSHTNQIHRKMTKFEAVVYLLTSSEGGRSSFVSDGYRTRVAVGESEHEAVLALDRDLYPGEMSRAGITMLGDYDVQPGDSITLVEGFRPVAKGLVMEHEVVV